SGSPSGIIKEGGSTLAISGTADPGSLGTTVNVGPLAVNGTLSGSVTTSGGTTLTGTGATLGSVDVNGILNPGSVNGAGTLTASGPLTLEGGASLTFDLSPTNTASGGVNDLLVANGTFNTSGNQINLNLLQPQAKLQNGSYRLINYSGGV